MNIGILRRIEDAPAYVRATAAAVAVTAITLIAYSNSFQAGFHLDDVHQITGNHYIRNLSNMPRFFTEAGVNTSLPDIDFYRPVTTASFAVNYALGELEPAGYHVFNIAFHILNALLVFVIVRFVLSRSGGPRSFALPLAASLLFAVHPIQTGAVTYISGRAVLLAAFFSLSALYSFMRYRESSGAAAYFWGVLSPVLLLLGLLSKEMTAATLGVMLAYDLIIRKDVGAKAARWLYYLCYAPSLGLLAWGWSTIGNRSAIPVMHYGIGEYMLSEAKVLLMYVRLLFLPINQNADYVLPITKTVDANVVVSAALVAASLYALYRIRNTMPAESFFGFWFFIALLPESSFLPILDIAVEYRLYMPAAGFITLVALLADRVVKISALKTAAVLSLAALFCILTFSRNIVYADELSYWRDIASKSPNSGRAARSYGDALVVKGLYREAIPVLERALTLERPFPEPYIVLTKLGMCYYQLGRIDEAEKIFKQALKEGRDFLPAYDSLGSLYYETGRYEEAAAVFLKETRVSIGNPQAEYNLGVSLMMLSRDGEAIDRLEEALYYGLDGFDLRYNLATLYERTGHPKEALTHAGAAMELAADESERSEAAGIADRLGKAAAKREAGR